MPKASEVLTTAANLVGGDREKQHGNKEDNFRRIAAVWNGWLHARKGGMADAVYAPLSGHDVAIMMALMKAARTQSGSYNPDDGIDGAGYFACAAEIASLPHE